ncbi:homeobox-leucine zipper protein [Musa troglodytarum]|uniref:Homeobox-leucine zipper protein n=1 Tax=Musa troglodytarum TaxID=320322 RepID=A0A9E7G6R6_9LILI|nr:homeobox-leucine zipper protein [Musa troglodytarum]
MDACKVDMCSTGLSLALNYRGKSTDFSVGNRPRQSSGLELEISSSTAADLEPSLTLGLPGDGRKACSVGRVVGRQYSPPHSVISSFPVGHPSNINGEEVWPRISDEEEYGTARKKLRLTKGQSALLEDKFREHGTLTPKQKQDLAQQLNLRPRQVEVWFQNRRARTKLKKTEAELEFLRKCCERLTEENMRLQKELQELKSQKSSAPRYTQLHEAAPAFAMCPSCNKVTGAADGSGSGFLAAASKRHFSNPFAHCAAR